MTNKDCERFMRKVGQQSDGCWEWLAYKNRRGYGRFMLHGRVQMAHRVMFAMCFKRDPGELCVLHSCDNPGCVNPHHLSLGTNNDNVRDRVNRGRTTRPRGPSNGRSILTEDDVIAIKASGDRGVDLAAKYGVATTTICDIRRGRNWSWLK